jgi:hypothetical protein
VQDRVEEVEYPYMYELEKKEISSAIVEGLSNLLTW